MHLSPHREENGMAKVLVIEDDAHIWKVIEYKLKKEKHDLIWASDGLRALQILKKFKPDLIISDIMVPYLDGFQFLKKVKKIQVLKAIPVILLTSKAQEKDVIKGLELGAHDYLTKPFSPAELILRVNRILKIE